MGEPTVEALRRGLVAAVLALGCAADAATRAGSVVDGEAAPRLELAVAGANERGIVLELANTGAGSIEVPAAHARLDVRRDGEPVRACERARRTWVRVPAEGVRLGPGEARRVTVPLACALGVGEHTVFVDVVLGDGVDPRAPAPLAEHLAASGTIEADEALALAAGRRSSEVRR